MSFPTIESMPLAPFPQVIVLGRGMNGMLPSDLTTQRAIAARNFSDNHHPESVIFSGAGTAVAPNMLGFRQSEAQAMEDIAALPSGVSKTEGSSTTTAENFLYCAELLDQDQPVGVFAHANHLPRALYLGSRILAQPLVGIRAEDFGASPEPTKSVLMERVIHLGTRAMYLGVGRADPEAFLRRDARINGIRNLARTVLRPFLQMQDAYN